MGADIMPVVGINAFVLKIGAAEAFPRVMLLVGRRESETLPSRVLYEWQLWDIVDQKI